MKVALIHDWLTGMRGGERCLEAFTEIFPTAKIFTLLHVPGKTSHQIESVPIESSVLSRLPGISRYYRSLLPVFPWLVERFDLSGFKLVLSSSHCVAKGVRIPPGALHIAYIYTPMRYVWDMYDEYFGSGRTNPILRAGMALFRHRLQRWDTAVSDRVDHFVAISRNVADRIRRHYGRGAVVIHPPVDTARFRVGHDADDFYLVVSAFAPYKRLDLAIRVCNAMARTLKIVGTGQDERRLRALAGPTVEFLGWRSDEEVSDLYMRCRALLFPGLEDFGITPVEAMASGRPVIAYGKGGVLDTILPLNPPADAFPGRELQATGPKRKGKEPTGVFFYEQTVEAFMDAIRLFEANRARFDAKILRDRALAFDRQAFKSKMRAYIEERWFEHLTRTRHTTC